MADEADKPKISASVLKAAERYLAKMRKGERIMRDANDRLQWASGKPVGRKTVEYLMSEGRVRPLDTDLFGDHAHGQTIGLSS